MSKQEIVVWLNANSEKPDEEIKKFLFSKIKNNDSKESWQQHYFLEDLKSPVNGFSEKILKIISAVEKDTDGVPMLKRYIAYVVDLFIIGIVISIIDSVGAVSSDLINLLVICIYFLYFVLIIYKFKTTLGLYIFKIKIEFDNKDNLLLKIFAREMIFLSLLTGVGFIYYLIRGSYWDKITGAHVVWAK